MSALMRDFRWIPVGPEWGTRPAPLRLPDTRPKRESVTTLLKPSEVRAVRRIARREGVSVARVVRKAVRDLLNEEAEGA